MAQPRNYYVSAPTNQPAGSDGNPGTLARPFATIQKAADLVLPGDSVIVRGGTYSSPCTACNLVEINRPGAPGRWIVFINYPGERPLVKFTEWGGMLVRAGAAYIEINGFRVQGGAAGQTVAAAQVQNSSCDANGTIRPGPFEARFNGNGINADGRGFSPTRGLPHHLRFVNNEVFECGGGGMGAGQADYVTIENNLIYNNSFHTIFGTSGISIYQSWDYDRAPGYHTVVRNNRCFGNRLFVNVYTACDITDGNGIIIDDNRNTQNNSTLGPYQSRTLVANNVCVNNGGSGIHAYSSDHVDIVNNTAYFNSQSPECTGGEIYTNDCDDVLIQNNILVATPDNGINSGVNTPAARTTTTHNLHFGGNAETVPGTATVRADPRFVNPTLDWRTADFRLQATSPALDAGLAAGAPATDYAGQPRPQGAGVDLGAFELAGPTPPTTGFSGTYRLLARHSGKALDVSGSGTASGTRVQQWSPNGSPAQQWQIEAVGGGYYRLTAQCSGKALDVRGNTNNNGEVVHQWDYFGQANQQWAIEPTTGGYYRLLARHSGKCLHVVGISVAEGAAVQQWDYVGGNNQQWKIEPATAAARAAGASLRLFPNPAGLGPIQVSGAQAGADVRLLDLSGREQLRTRADATGHARLQCPAGLPAGLYVVQAAGQTLRLALE